MSATEILLRPPRALRRALSELRRGRETETFFAALSLFEAMAEEHSERDSG